MTRFGISIPQTLLDRPFDPSRWRSWFQRAEALGYDSLWAVEQVLGGTPTLESLTLLSYAAALTERVRLGVAVLILGLREPVALAKQLSSLDVLSGGRLTVGLGLGGNPKVYPAYGLSAEHRVSRFKDDVDLMKALWTEPRVSLDSPFHRVQQATMEPKPVQKPHPPVWFGGHHPDALQRAATMADGFLGAGSISTQGFLEELAILRACQLRPGFTVGKRVYLAIDDSREKALQRLRGWFGAFYGKAEMADDMAVYGSVDEVVAGLRRLTEARLDFILLNPVDAEEAHLARLAHEVIPRLTD
ncbi:MAG TPA: LLM class flavin-dependent oxidoreductase [Candidatus Xenobia bacterium]|jgi:alkanesulfonate monooxygenase SsuD/methylene tetrahydromethanopterin reductase-like flavin-dependent oxidoreductase (luciferase family)